MKAKRLLAVLLAAVMLVVPLTVCSFAAGVTIVSQPVKTTYNDSEFFNPQGLVINDGVNDIEYSPTDSNFRFDPALNEYLTVDTTAVRVFYKNEFVGTVPVKVEHILGDLVCIDSVHGRYCIGCGELVESEPHVINEWIPNDDGGIFTLQTETGTCEVCGGTVTQTIPGSDKFLSLFPNTEGALTEFEAEIIMYFYTIVVSLVQMIVGIS